MLSSYLRNFLCSILNSVNIKLYRWQWRVSLSTLQDKGVKSMQVSSLTWLVSLNIYLTDESWLPCTGLWSFAHLACQSTLPSSNRPHPCKQTLHFLVLKRWIWLLSITQDNWHEIYSNASCCTSWILIVSKKKLVPSCFST